MKVLTGVFTFLLIAIHPNLYSQDNAYKLVEELEEYVIKKDKQNSLSIFDKSEQLLSSYNIGSLSNPQKKLRKLTYVSPTIEYQDLPRKCYSSFFENDSKLIFSFREKQGNQKLQSLVIYDKASNKFSTDTILYRVNKGLADSDDSFILDSLVFVMHSNRHGILIKINSLYQQDLTLKTLGYLRDKEVTPYNYLSPQYYSLDDFKSFYEKSPKQFKQKKRINRFNRLINLTARNGSKIKAEYLGDQYIKITAGVHAHDQTSLGDIVIQYFEVVLDKDSFEYVSTEEVKRIFGK